MPEPTLATLTLWLGALITAIAVLRLLTVEDLLARLIAVNVTGGGTLLVLVGLAVRATPSDPVPQALALTGIVITVAFTGVGLVLLKAIHDDDAHAAPENTSPAAPTGEDADSDRGRNHDA
ncbi:NADH-quinone oxidoreductase subunit K [Kocuria sp.]|uniref:NADH-quinone oxidoreductase subunit K n=1 Tax=Kocuria sp. TaxID=1871328 RepID=UPI0026DF1CB7|nr:NADH-quinone oxidoreductase subunit K [Kocuria sp.]MDO5619616.1 NADH-quinone oxidoreductase subunit K [Kocuria sp.]